MSGGQQLVPLAEFWKIAAKLKDESRKGWKQQLALRRVESVADHSYGVAMLALFEGERRRWDVEKCLKLALIHDLDEAITGDLTPIDKKTLSPGSVKEWRNSAKNRILSNLPARMKRSYIQLWRDLESGLSKEARLVKQLDKLEMAFHAHEYEKRGIQKQRLADFYESASEGIKDKVLRQAFRQVVLTD